MSRTKTEVADETKIVESVETVKAVETPVANKVVESALSPLVGLMSTLSAAKKIGVTRYLQLYPQNTYVEAAMKFNYKSKVYTVDEWHKIAAKVKKTLGVE